MKEKELINKYLVWMIIFSESNPLSYLKLTKTKYDETSLSSYVPAVDTTITAVDEDIEVAFKTFFEDFDKAIENYLSDKPSTKKFFYKELEKMSLETVSKELEEEQEYLQSILNDLEKMLIEEESIPEA